MKVHYINYRKKWRGPCSDQPGRKYSDKISEVTCTACLKRMGVPRIVSDVEGFINGLHQLL